MLTGLTRSLAEEFRSRCPPPILYPFNMDDAIVHVAPISVTRLAAPHLSAVYEWFHRHRIPVPDMGAADRELFGCIALFRGYGFVFVDGTLNEDERRFTLAHEFAHYLLHYNYPRQRAVKRLGNSIIEVLDGDRSPSVEERVHAALEDVQLGVYTHLMTREAGTRSLSDAVNQAEAAADTLALELLAPYKAVLRCVPNREAMTTNELEHVLTPVLCQNFGIPAGISSQYAAMLAYHFGRTLSVREWLGL